VTPNEAIPLLNDLIETCKDGEQGYQTAAEHVQNTQLKTIFSDYAKQRGEFARHLQAEVERLGGNPTDSGTVTAALHRGWMDLKSALSGGDGAAIIAACETGEDSAAAAFERVVNMELTGQTKSLVEKQWRQIKEAHAHMLLLKEEAAGSDFPKNE
jgi:uncharacterized protein (TIGR02284 family)